MSSLAHGVAGPDLPFAVVDLAVCRTPFEQEAGVATFNPGCV